MRALCAKPVISNNEGVYKIELPFGKNTLEFNRDGFKTYIVKNFENFSKTDKSFDVDFIIGHCADCNGAIYGERDKNEDKPCLLYTSPSPRDRTRSRMPSSA